MRLVLSTSKPKLVKLPYNGQNGAYVGMTPSKNISELASKVSAYLGFETDVSKLHVTVMYSKVPLKVDSKSIIEEAPKSIKGLIVGVEQFKGHDEKLYTVLILQSTELYLEHSRLLKAGAKHTFMYRPHITLSNEAPAVKARLLDSVNKYLLKEPFPFQLDGWFLSNLKD